MIIDTTQTKEIVSPDTVGAWPIRQDTTVLPAYDSSGVKLRCPKIYICAGFSIRRVVNGANLTPEQKHLDNKWPRDKEDKPIHHMEIDSEGGIVEGDEVLVKTLSNNHYESAIIVKTDGKFYADSKYNLYDLEFIKNIDHPDRPDEKAVWIMTLCMNKSCFTGITKLSVTE